MATTAIDRPVTVMDNVMRSFIPPCFCFELYDSDGVRVATVSQVLKRNEDNSINRDFDVLSELRSNKMMALGVITCYDAGVEARERGRRFKISQIVHADRRD